jgi:hypothetical protein
MWHTVIGEYLRDASATIKGERGHGLEPQLDRLGAGGPGKVEKLKDHP